MEEDKETSDPTQGSSNNANLNDNNESNSTDSLGGIFGDSISSVGFSSSGYKTPSHYCPACGVGFRNLFELRYHIQLYFINNVARNPYTPAVICPRPKYPDYDYLLLVRRLNSLTKPTADSSSIYHNRSSDDFCRKCGTPFMDLYAPSTSAAAASMEYATKLFLKNFVRSRDTQEIEEAGSSGSTNVDDSGSESNYSWPSSSRGSDPTDVYTYWRNYAMRLYYQEKLAAKEAHTSGTSTDDSSDSVKSSEDDNRSSSFSGTPTWSVTSKDQTLFKFWKGFLPRKETAKKPITDKDQLRGTKNDFDTGGSGNDEDCGRAGDSAVLTSSGNESCPSSHLLGASASISTAVEEPSTSFSRSSLTRPEAKKKLTPVEEVDITMSTSIDASENIDMESTLQSAGSLPDCSTSNTASTERNLMTSVDRTRGTKRCFDVGSENLGDAFSPALKCTVSTSITSSNITLSDSSASTEKPLSAFSKKFFKKRVVQKQSSSTSSSDSTCPASTSSNMSSSFSVSVPDLVESYIDKQIELAASAGSRGVSDVDSPSVSQQESPAPISLDNDNSYLSGRSTATTTDAASMASIISITTDTSAASATSAVSAASAISEGSDAYPPSGTSAISASSLPFDASVASAGSSGSAGSGASAGSGSATSAPSITFDTSTASVSYAASADSVASAASKTSAPSIAFDASTASVSSAASAASAPEPLISHKRHFDISIDTEVIKRKLSKSDSAIAEGPSTSYKKRPKKSFSCCHCGKTLRRYNHLVYHYRMHNHQTPIKCPRCHKVFDSSFACRLHRHKCHKRQGDSKSKETG